MQKKIIMLTVIPHACIRSATSFPIRPSPMMARVFPLSSCPAYSFLSHLPAFSDALAAVTFRAKFVISAQVSSHALIALPPGVLKNVFIILIEYIETNR